MRTLWRHGLVRFSLCMLLIACLLTTGCSLIQPRRGGALRRWVGMETKKEQVIRRADNDNSIPNAKAVGL